MLHYKNCGDTRCCDRPSLLPLHSGPWRRRKLSTDFANVCPAKTSLSVHCPEWKSGVWHTSLLKCPGTLKTPLRHSAVRAVTEDKQCLCCEYFYKRHRCVWFFKGNFTALSLSLSFSSPMPCTQLAAAQTCLTNLLQQCLSTHPTFPLSASMMPLSSSFQWSFSKSWPQGSFSWGWPQWSFIESSSQCTAVKLQLKDDLSADQVTEMRFPPMPASTQFHTLHSPHLLATLEVWQNFLQIFGLPLSYQVVPSSIKIDFISSCPTSFLP